MNFWVRAAIIVLIAVFVLLALLMALIGPQYSCPDHTTPVLSDDKWVCVVSSDN